MKGSVNERQRKHPPTAWTRLSPPRRCLLPEAEEEVEESRLEPTGGRYLNLG